MHSQNGSTHHVHRDTELTARAQPSLTTFYRGLELHSPAQTDEYSAAGWSAGTSCICSFCTHCLVHINSAQGTNQNVTVIVSSNGNTSINFHLSKQLAVSINYGDSQLTVAAAK